MMKYMNNIKINTKKMKQMDFILKTHNTVNWQKKIWCKRNFKVWENIKKFKYMTTHQRLKQMKSSMMIL